MAGTTDLAEKPPQTSPRFKLNFTSPINSPCNQPAMVPKLESTAQRRCRQLAAENDSNSALFASSLILRKTKAPIITYGKRSKPLSLAGNQFFRRDVHELPSEEDHQTAPATALLRNISSDDSESDDSPLSDADSANDDRTERISHVTSRHEALKAVSPGTEVEVGRSSQAAVHQVVKRDPAALPKSRNVSMKHRVAKRTSKTPSRRLPVGELYLVRSPTLHDADPLSEIPGIERQDPISDFSTQHRQKSLSELPRRESKTPLASIRQRLSTSGFRHKASKRKQGTSHNSGTPQACIGDGFEVEELDTSHYARVRRQRRRRQGPTSITYNALELGIGPLPDVVFECGTDELQLELSGGPHHVASQQRDNILLRGDQQQAESTNPSSKCKRKVSFSDREHLILAQLSSISAPERSDSEPEEEDESESEEESESDERDSGDNESLDPKPDDTTTEDRRLLDFSKPLQYEEEVVRPVDDNGQAAGAPPVTSKLGVTLDFRKHITPGSLRGRMLGKRSLIEVDEAIDDGPSRAVRVVYGDHVSHPPDSQRPRSILKNSTSSMPDATSHPEHTTANTRRNSMVDVDESRYFATAADLLDTDTAPRHCIVPRRHSTYFEEPLVQVADSGRIVPETSPEPPNYTTTRQLNILRQTSEASWTSQSLPVAQRDLKTLTRSVSRENGTVSQSVRRRPSLPFQSPTKVR